MNGRHNATVPPVDQTGGRFSWNYRWLRPLPSHVAGTLVRAADGFWRHGDLFTGAAISFYALLSLLPLTILMLVILQLVVPASFIAHHLGQWFGGRAGSDLIPRIVGEAYAQERSLGWWGLLTLVIAATGVFAAVQTALDRIWERQGRIMYLRFLIGALTMATSLVIFLGVLVVSMLVFRLSRAAGLGGLPGGPPVLRFGMQSAMNIAAALAQFGIFWTRYRWLPSAPVLWRDAWPGAVVASVAWQAISYGLNWYLAVVGSYTTFYHELQAIVALFFWAYGLACSFLFGAEFVAQWTKGPRLPRRLAAAER